MEALESGPVTSSSSDPLLSAALSTRSAAVPPAYGTDDYRTHLNEASSCYHTLNGGRISPHTTVSTSAGAVFNQYTTLQPLRALPPISTVTNSAEKFGLRTSNPTTVAETRTSNDTATNTMTAVNRSVKRCSPFGENQSGKSPLSRHYKHIRLNVTHPIFLISYWMSLLSSHGFRMISKSLHLTSSMEFHITRSEEPMNSVARRRNSKWSVSNVSAQLANVQMHLFGGSTRPMNDKFIIKNNDDSFFVCLDRLSYMRESMLQVNLDLASSKGSEVDINEFDVVNRLA